MLFRFTVDVHDNTLWLHIKQMLKCNMS